MKILNEGGFNHARRSARNFGLQLREQSASARPVTSLGETVIQNMLRREPTTRSAHIPSTLRVAFTDDTEGKRQIAACPKGPRRERRTRRNGTRAPRSYVPIPQRAFRLHPTPKRTLVCILAIHVCVSQAPGAAAIQPVLKTWKTPNFHRRRPRPVWADGA